MFVSLSPSMWGGFDVFVVIWDGFVAAECV